MTRSSLPTDGGGATYRPYVRARGRLALPMLAVPLLAVLLLLGVSACASAAKPHPAPAAAPSGTASAESPAEPSLTPVQAWMARTPMYIAHRGGDADWPEGTAYAYAQAARWNPDLALEVPVWRTPDGVWVVSEYRDTGRVFGADHDIPSTPWPVLAALRSLAGGQPMARLQNDVLDVYGRSRVLFVDNKQDENVGAFFALLDSYAGRTRYVIKSYWHSTKTPDEARRRGYVTWGYYTPATMGDVAATQAHFDMLGLDAGSSEAQFRTMEATGKPVIAHVVTTRAEVQRALTLGAKGVMVADVRAVVPG